MCIKTYPVFQPDSKGSGKPLLKSKTRPADYPIPSRGISVAVIHARRGRPMHHTADQREGEITDFPLSPSPLKSF